MFYFPTCDLLFCATFSYSFLWVGAPHEIPMMRAYATGGSGLLNLQLNQASSQSPCWLVESSEISIQWCVTNKRFPSRLLYMPAARPYCIFKAGAFLALNFHRDGRGSIPVMLHDRAIENPSFLDGFPFLLGNSSKSGWEATNLRFLPWAIAMSVNCVDSFPAYNQTLSAKKPLRHILFTDFSRKSHRIASFLMLSNSKIVKVSQNFFVLELSTSIVWGSFAEFMRFGPVN